MTQPPPNPTRPSGPGTNGFAIASLVLGVTGACFLAVPFGIVALSKIRRTRQKGRGMAITGLVLSGVWVVVLAFALLLGQAPTAARDDSGTIVSQGLLSTQELRVGDCLIVPAGDAALQVNAVPCADLHTGEVYALVTIDEPYYPGDDEIARRAEEGCLDRLDDQAPDLLDDDGASIAWFQPQESSWNRGNRDMTCVVTSVAPRSGSILDPASPAETAPAS